MASTGACDGEPFTFSVPGEEPDTSINVFGKEIYAHSTVLKSQSAFFLKFMDAPNPPEPCKSGYRYKYVTVVDEDGELWGLEKDRPSLVDRTFKGYPEREIRAFFRLLLAMYKLPYVFEDSEDVLDMKGLAEFYFASPIMASSLTTALLGSPPLIQDNPYVLLVVAESLEHPLLFRECVVHLTTQWKSEDVEAYKEAGVPTGQLIEKVQNQMYAKVVKTEEEVMEFVLNKEILDSEYVTRMSTLWTDLGGADFTNRQNLFLYYEGINKQCLQIAASHPRSERNDAQEGYQKWHSDLAQIISPLMKNNLLFPTEPSAYFSPYFNCAEIADEDLPWNSKKQKKSLEGGPSWLSSLLHPLFSIIDESRSE